MAPPSPSDGAATAGDPDGLPDLSHLTQEERQIILQVMQRQKAEQQQEEEIAQKGDRELWDIERQIQERKEIAQRLIGTQDDAICQICQKTKFADGIGHKCFYCQLRSCARCGGRTTSKNKTIWACSLCQKRQQILAKTGKWFQQEKKQLTASTPSPGGGGDGGGGDGGGSSAPISRQHSEKSTAAPSGGDYDDEHTARRQSLAAVEERPATAGGPAYLRRQSTLQRQSSVEQDHHHQLQHQTSSLMNGDSVERRRASTIVSSSTNVLSQSPSTAPNGHRQRQMSATYSGTEQPNEPNGGGQLQNDEQNAINNSRSIERHQQQQQRQKRIMAEEQRQMPQLQQLQTNGATGDDRHQLTSKRNAILEERQHLRKQQQQQQRLSSTTACSSMAASRDRQSFAENGQAPRVPGTELPSQYAAASSAGVASTPAVVVIQPPSSEGGSSSSIKRQSVVAASSGGGGVPSPMRRRPKASRQQPPLANCSSSDDELSSARPKPTTTQQLPQSQPPPLPNVPPAQNNSLDIAGGEKDFSEKELLRYIYDNVHPNARKAVKGGTASGPFCRQFQHRSLDSPMLSASTSSRGIPFGNATKSSATDFSNPLASRIKNYLSNLAVSWQPSTDQRRLIGHLVLQRPPRGFAGPSSSSSPILSNCSLDFGIKVVGGRNPSTGRLGAFVSRVRPGSVADSVGHLRTGDEVLEWNGHSLQNVTPETVYKIVQSTKSDIRLELIVSRPLTGGSDDFLNLSRIREQYGPSLPHSQSLISASPFGHQQRYSQRAPSPLVLHQGGSFNDFFDPSAVVWPPPFPGLSIASADPSEMCGGRLELSLLYLRQKRELIISLSRACDLLPRPNGAPRNAYAKLFLLPDRSERSRRQSKVVSDSLAPVWNEHFFYEGLDERTIAARVLEVTLWDFDPYESHSFLGEMLIELSNAPMNNRPLLYSLTDMDDDSFIRLRLRQRRYSSMTPPIGHRSRSQMSYPVTSSSSRRGYPISEGRSHDATDYWESQPVGIGNSNSHSAHNLTENHSRNKRFAIANDNFWKSSQEDWRMNEEEAASFTAGGWEGAKRGGGKRIPNGYLSDQEQEWEMERRRHGTEHRRERREHRHHRGEHRDRGGQRRPQSATALRNIAEWEMRHKPSSSDRGGKQYHYQQSMDCCEEDRSGGVVQRQQQQQLGRATRQQELREQEATTSAGGGGGGYGSDGSVETLMSVNSAQSMQNRAILRQQQLQRLSEQNDDDIAWLGQSSTEDTNDRMAAGEALLPAGGADVEDMDEQQMMMMAAMEGGRQGGTNAQQQRLTMKELKDRKKSLMTRLIPGRNGFNDANKRLGFARSEEVGIPEALMPPEQNKDFIKQESTDSSDNWLPIRPDRPLGSFVENLGPGQVVGRQALGSTQLGELQAALSLESTGMVVDIMQARGLTVLKQGTKTVPGIYVKAYLMEGKNCLAKAKTQSTKTKSASPQFRQKLVFAEGPRYRMLQLTVLADYGRIERKSFLGVAQIALDELQLSKEPLLGWFKLFPSSSLNGAVQPPAAGGAPSRKNSEVSTN